MSLGSPDRTGTATYDEDTKTWHTKAKTRYLTTGETTVSEGTAKMVDDNTLEWQHAEWDSWKLKKYFEMKGTSRRK
ncbi:MAG: hypothetical protein KAY37_17655 [Phycisphaerae bacterium]|nr:hypothetical protein [Phycisphaerae bacterium]